MRAVDIIAKKRDGKTLEREEIEFFIERFTAGSVPDYQAAAFAMAVYLQGMSEQETVALTLAMANSGDVLDLSDAVAGIVVDKHSTGGVGDKTTLVVEPVVVACGVPMGKMSGRGLGYSGGTLDKMESIAGYNSDLTTAAFKQQLRDIGIVLAGQTADLAPADGKLYALRDVTATVASIPLIASSVMCKKIAGGAQAIVLDVKVGTGAFMTTLEDARVLADTMVRIGRGAGRRVVALLSDMNQPLGSAVGNALEVKEAISTLRGFGSPDFVEHALHVAGHLLVLAGAADDLAEAGPMATAAIDSGAALEKFRALVSAQGGDAAFVDDFTRFPQAALTETLKADVEGNVARIDAHRIGEAAVRLGAGRARKGDLLDLSVGIEVHVKVGDAVRSGQPLLTVHANDPGKLSQAIDHLVPGIEIVDRDVAPLPLFHGAIYSDV
ncbi:MAG: thymidine phosphorylase [Anaerolineales bacterium]